MQVAVCRRCLAAPAVYTTGRLVAASSRSRVQFLTLPAVTWSRLLKYIQRMPVDGITAQQLKLSIG